MWHSKIKSNVKPLTFVGFTHNVQQKFLFTEMTCMPCAWHKGKINEASGNEGAMSLFLSTYYLTHLALKCGKERNQGRIQGGPSPPDHQK